MKIQNVGDAAPILHARFSDAVPWARDRRPISAGTNASANRAGGYHVVLADGRRILGLQGLRRRREILNEINWR